MKVILRKRKIKNGLQESLYLEFYKGYEKLPNGKLKHFREFETLNLIIHTKPKTQTQKQENKDNLELAEKIRVKKQNEYNSGKYGFRNEDKLKYNFLDYFKKLTEDRFNSKNNYGNWDSVYKHLQKYCSPNTKFSDIDEDFVRGFKRYLELDARTKSNIGLSKNTQNSYFNKFRASINQAQKDKIIIDNPVHAVKGIKAETPPREYLTFDELKRLSKTNCKYPVLKRAFIFSCLTGLRWSDIQKMTWSEVRDSDNELRIIFQQKKTNDIEYLDISPQARSLMGKRRKSNERVFEGLRYSVTYNSALLRWCHETGIYKHITFHCARHTNAVLLLEMGADIYTVSKRLGHQEIRTTEIYAKIVDKKMKEAANIIPSLNLDINDNL
ncbi:tyrosine-type recombinase/integrase [Marinifilum sp. D737]|uniref:tyrosine-type recombinase/integrase n=1 Tax=Marinifilum sp. D737 TaxID=2969628 RepID=UPI0022745905|nr:site-specific integrase [Marinifilum sp. D737]MCY1633909.1 site-specific integrase [Marinifilum sp. D737]